MKMNVTEGPVRELASTGNWGRRLACVQCRRSKLKCDHGYPACGTCIRRKTPSLCVYEMGPLSQTFKNSLSTTYPSNETANLSQTATLTPDNLHMTILKMPSSLSRTQSSILSPNNLHLTQDNVMATCDNGKNEDESWHWLEEPNFICNAIFKGAEPKTRYCGNGITSSLLLQVIFHSIHVGLMRLSHPYPSIIR